MINWGLLIRMASSAQWRSIFAKGIPDSLWDEYYANYLQSEAWKRKRAACLEAAGGRCSMCGTDVRLQAHHTTYERVGDELPEDLVALCVSCHGAEHKVRDYPKEIQEILKEIGCELKAAGEKRRRR